MQNKIVKYRILLIRHGKPDVWLLPITNRKVKIEEIKGFFNMYDLSGIDSNYKPKEKLLNLLPVAKKVFTSELKRAIQSYQYFELPINNEVNTVFNEAGLPIFKNSFLKFYPKSWLAILRTMWFLGFSNKTTSRKQTRMRATEAALYLKNEVINEGCIALFGHGIFNYFIKKRLMKTGGVLIGKWDYGYWGCNEIVFYE